MALPESMKIANIPAVDLTVPKPFVPVDFSQVRAGIQDMRARANELLSGQTVSAESVEQKQAKPVQDRRPRRSLSPALGKI